MPWVKLDDGCTEHPKLVALGVDGFCLWVSGLCYCNRNLTDGFIPDVIAFRLFGANESSIDRLVAAEVWDVCDGGYRVHDYLDFQPSRETVRQERRKGADRQAAWRDRNRSNGVSNAVTNGSPVPVPVEAPSGASARTREEETTERVGGSPVTDRERTAARLLVERFNETFGTRFTAKAHQSRIVSRLRSHPDCPLEEHYLMIDAASADRWWKGNPGPQVVWGNDSVFENLREKAGALDRSRRAQAAARLREEEARREREDVELVGPTPEALAALARLGVKRLDDHLEEGHHDREVA